MSAPTPPAGAPPASTQLARPRDKALAFALSVGAPGLVGTAALRWALRARELQRSAMEDVPRRPVVLILGANVRADGSPTPGLRLRLAAGLEIFRRGRAERILVSGIGQGRQGGETRAMQTWLCARGVPVDRVMLDPLGVRTRASLERAVDVFGIRSAHLCTHAFHLPRALFWAHATGLDVTPIAADPPGAPWPPVRHRRWMLDRLREGGAWSLAVSEGLSSHKAISLFL